MAFIKSDLYTSSGAVGLYHCWTENVTKFGSDTFYNWEQDNMPVYDLEERTFYLWEQLGYPTSSIPGVALVVSADAPDINCNTNVFRTVSAAVQAIPQIINYPIIMEIANFGQLGNLILSNYKFGPRGSLEIINRNFATDIPHIGILNSTSMFQLVSGFPDLDNFKGFDKYLYTSSINSELPGYLSQISVTNPFGAASHFRQASCLSISAAVFSSTFDSRLSGNGIINGATVQSKLNGYIAAPRNTELQRSTLTIGSSNGNTNPFNPSVSSQLNFRAYDYFANGSDEVTSKDVSVLNLFLNPENHLYYANTLFSKDYNTPNIVNNLFYGNVISKIIVTNCDGPIFIRNFFVDGSGSLNSNNNNGVEINNCPNIYLENIVSTRHRKAGLLFNNSNVIITRNCVATRNYDFSGNLRITDNWNTRIKDISYSPFKSTLPQDTGAGMVANNSTINFSSTQIFESANFKPHFSAMLPNLEGPDLNPQIHPHNTGIYEFSKNANGIVLNNSTILGGATEDWGVFPYANYGSMNFSLDNNVGFGLKLSNSQFLLNGRLLLTENLIGCLVDSSVFEIDNIIVGLNQLTGIELVNSVMKYNRNKMLPKESEEQKVQYLFSGNGQHLNLINSKIEPFTCKSMNKKYGRMQFKESIGVFQSYLSNKLGILPSISLKNNSEAVLIHPLFIRQNSALIAKEATRGSEISVTNGSTIVLKGSSDFATQIFGPIGSDDIAQSKLAAVYAGNNSIIEINGPTVIANFGIALLAEDKSTININPHRDRSNGSLDVSSFELLDSKNHTQVEIHSTRACIVANKQSSLNIKDLGSYEVTWDRSNLGKAALSGTDYKIDDDSLNKTKYVSGGFLQFYPNPNDHSDYLTSEAKSVGYSNTTNSPNNFTQSTVSSHPNWFLINPTASFYDFSTVTNGGMCVRLTDSSIANVTNVNFPCGWWVPSGIYFDTSAPGSGRDKLCNKLFIWNIAGGSQLRAGLVSVSGLFPATAGYIGPSGVWGAAGVVTSGVPSSTPDTSTISILDYFGKSASSDNLYGKFGTPQNFGPFRLYFSVNPAVNALNSSAGDNYGAIRQIYSQGYQYSGNMIASGNVSSLYPMLLKFNNSNLTKISPSGYYYSNEIMDNPNTIAAYLDESASELFANAKHCSVGKSNLAKKVSILLPYTDTPIGDSVISDKLGNGKGLKSVNQFDLERDN